MCSSADTRTYNGIDRGPERDVPAYLRTTLDGAAPTVSGSLRDPSASKVIAAGPLPGAAPALPTPVRINEIQGAWKLSDVSGNMNSLTVDADGAVVGNYRGCALDGTLQSPVTNAVPLELQVTLTCPANVWTLGLLRGFALAAGGGRQLLVWAKGDDGFDFDYVLAIGRR